MSGENSRTLTVTHNRTGEIYEIPVEEEGAVRAPAFRDIKVSEEDFGLLTYDPAFMNTASCKSSVTYIDGDRGILRYRGYPIEDLAEKSTFLEVAYLLIYGELPTKAKLDDWVFQVTHHTFLHENVKKFIDGFRHDAHPMGILLGTVGALSTFYPEAKQVQDEESRRAQMVRLIAKMPTIAAFAYRHAMGFPYVYPENDLSYAGNFLNMFARIKEHGPFSLETPSGAWSVVHQPSKKFELDPTLERALDILFILHADHEQNCSAHAVRTVGSSLADPYVAIAAGVAALYGPLHGGANEAVVRMLQEIGSVERVPEHIKRVKEGERRLMGFGHRVYRSYDPRAKIIKRVAEEVFEVTGRSPLIDIALELERIALEDEYFVNRKLYPNVDFYSGIIYLAMGFPVDMFPVLFAIGRTPGWLAQWEEGYLDPEQRISRPRQLYVGEGERKLVPIEDRS
jgi:citrate synthase